MHTNRCNVHVSGVFLTIIKLFPLHYAVCSLLSMSVFFQSLSSVRTSYFAMYFLPSEIYTCRLCGVLMVCPWRLYVRAGAALLSA